MHGNLPLAIPTETSRSQNSFTLGPPMSDRLPQNGGMKYTIRYYPGDPEANEPAWKPIGFCLLLAAVFLLAWAAG